MDTSEPVLFNHALGNQYRIFEVVAVPGHERDTHVLTQGQLTDINRRTVSKNVTAGYRITVFDQRLLGDAGILIRAGVLSQVIDINTCLTRVRFIVVDANNNSPGINALDDTASEGHHTDPGIPRHIALHTGTNQRLLRFKSGHCLTLHVRTHQRAVRIIVFKKRN